MFRILILCLFVVSGSVAHGQSRTSVEKQFQLWLDQVVWPQARAVGVSQKTMEQAFKGVALNWDLPDLVPPGEAAQVPKQQFQSEFGSPGKYFNTATVRANSSTGREMAQRHAAALARIEAETGVPGRILLAIWGRESAFGQAPIRHDAFQVLGTKAFMSTRSAYFTTELVAALKIAELGYFPDTDLKSSWAGALGQPQFMPSSFLAYAADGDGDGVTDIWRSPEDTLASIANYLAQYGWVADRDWGFEVVVPETVSCALEGPDQGRPIKEWVTMGVHRVSGKPFPGRELAGEGYLMMPAGRLGPAFLVTPNFYVLKEYNKSDLYALFVGHVGDRLQYGMGDFHKEWRSIDGVNRADIAAMQRALEWQGHDVGGVDGLPGFKTRRSIGRWQEANSKSPTCFPEARLKPELRP